MSYSLIITGYILRSLLTILLFAGGIWYLILLSRKTLWKQNFKSIWTVKRARISVVMISLFLTVFLIDSITLPVFRDVEGRKILTGSRTLLDVLYTPEREESYSSPFAKKQLTDKDTKNRGLHPFGTNLNGQDTLKNALKGIRVAITIAGLTTLIILPFGILFGLLAGYFGKATDAAVTYIYSTLASIPSILLLIALMNIFGQGIVQLCVALGITSWVGLCRIVRAETIRQKNMEYVQAARALGQSHFRIIFRHLLPNVMHIVLISSILRFSGLIMAEVILSFLGLGVPPEIASWGVMIDQARMELARDPMIWWNITAAFSLMFALILSVNFLGDTVRDVLDPRTRTIRTEG